MANPPNEQQYQAITEFNKNLLVSAGAGTGKTSVLTQKFLRLLEERRANVTGIVAITFTNKAAAEMRQRIQSGIESKLVTAAAANELEYWQTQLSQLENARICTFHSLCLGLIREHPLEAGIPPITGILSDGEETLYLKEAVTGVLTASYLNPDLDKQVYHQLFVEFGWDSLINSLMQIYREIRESGQKIAAVIETSDVRLKYYIENRPVEVENPVILIDNLLDFSRSQKLTERANEIIGSFLEKWTDWRQSIMTSSAEAVIPIFREVCKSLPKNLPNSIKPLVVAIHDTVDQLIRKHADLKAINRLPVIGELLCQIDLRYRELKQESGLVDFTDQQILARDLLRDNYQITEKLHSEIQYLLVDEFQDTNSLQMELIRFLVGNPGEAGRWMAVGDIKQSIYRFRGAEADVILQLREKFENENQVVIPLSINYRSNPMIINYVNQIFQDLLADENFTFEPLQATRSDAGSSIEFLLTGEEDLKSQAQQVAAYLVHLVEESRQLETPINYKDIVILFRASTSMPLFQQALQEADIPYYASGGSNFFFRQEIVDQFNLLRLVEQRYDAVALMGLLTSPYVGLSEESLFWLSQGEGLVAEFYESQLNHPEIPASELERLIRFRGVITELQENRDQYQITGIIRTALHQLHYREILWTLNNPGQRLANLEKLLAKADEYTAKGYTDLTRFLTYIQELESVDAGETDAPTQAESQNVVRLMTIHRAKGLEFPVVIIPDLDRHFCHSTGQKIIFHKKLGLGFKMVVAGDEATTDPLEEIKLLEKREEISELKRVLYVALTRAGQRLVLAGSGNSGSKGEAFKTANSWMRWFELLHPFPENNDFFDYNGIPVRIIREVPEVFARTDASILLNEFSSGFTENDSLGITTGIEVAATALTALRSKPLTLKVTEIITYKDCPRKFYFKYRLRLPEVSTGTIVSDFETAGPVDAMGTEIGNFFHLATRSESPEWPENLWQEHFTQQHSAAFGKVKDDVLLMWQNYIGSEYSKTGNGCWDEIPFTVKIDPKLRVEGRFDRLFVDETGQMRLVDYKTHRIPSEQTNNTARRYSWQLQLYALAVKTLWGKMPDRAELYFPYSGRSINVPLDDTSMASTITEIEKIAEMIANNEDYQKYPVKENCQGCHYSYFCGRKS